MESENKIIFAAVDKTVNTVLEHNHITYFPNETELRKFRLGRKDVIWLDELADKKCKKCNGTGKVGTFLKQFPEVKPIEKLLLEHLDNPGHNLALALMKLMQLPNNLQRPLEMLLAMAMEDLTDDNLEAIACKYAKQIRNDFAVRTPQWCICFKKAYAEAVKEVTRNIKFGVN